MEKTVLYFALIAGLVTLIVTNHPIWAIVFLFLIDSVKD